MLVLLVTLVSLMAWDQVAEEIAAAEGWAVGTCERAAFDVAEPGKDESA